MRVLQSAPDFTTHLHLQVLKSARTKTASLIVKWASNKVHFEWVWSRKPHKLDLRGKAKTQKECGIEALWRVNVICDFKLLNSRVCECNIITGLLPIEFWLNQNIVLFIPPNKTRQSLKEAPHTHTHTQSEGQAQSGHARLHRQQLLWGDDVVRQQYGMWAATMAAVCGHHAVTHTHSICVDAVV